MGKMKLIRVETNGNYRIFTTGNKKRKGKKKKKKKKNEVGIQLSLRVDEKLWLSALLKYFNEWLKLIALNDLKNCIKILCIVDE